VSAIVSSPPRDRAVFLNEGVPPTGLRGAAPTSDARVPWRISPQPFPLRPETVARLSTLGDDLLAFYRAANRLYHDSAHGHAPAWVHEYLDQGKGDRVRELGLLRRYRTHVPLLLRPDLMALEDGTFRATELDSIPGGFGSLAAFSQRYAALGFDLIGGPHGLVDGFAAALRHLAGKDDAMVAIVVSDEAKDYRAEMAEMAAALRARGLRAVQAHPRDVGLQGNCVCIETDEGRHAVDVLYRFFELSDLPNIPRMDLIVYAMKHRLVAVTPPFKAYLEEKALMALFHHPALREMWVEMLGAEAQARLAGVFPLTWILDPRPIPPHAAITPPLVTADQAIRRWSDLLGLSQKQRRLVLKPSGFSELAWGSRGVVVGHDVRTEVWDRAVGDALAGYAKTPYVIQPYHQSRRVAVDYFDFESDTVRALDGRARVSPYYFVAGDRATLAGVLVTVVPAANKTIHGTPEAVLAPAMVAPEAVI